MADDLPRELTFDKCKFVWDPVQGTWTNPEPCDTGGRCPAMPTAINQDVIIRLNGEGPIVLKVSGEGVMEVMGGEERVLTVVLNRSEERQRDTTVIFECVP